MTKNKKKNKKGNDMPPKARKPRETKPAQILLYHSELVRLKGPAKITVDSEVKKAAGKKAPYVELTYKGEKREYVIDNPNLSAFFAGQVGRTMSIIAEGGKGDETLTYVGDALPDDAPAGKSTRPAPKAAENKAAGAMPPRREPEHHEEPGRESEEQIKARYDAAISHAKNLAGRHTVLAAIAADAAEVVARRHEAKHKKAMSEERIQGIGMRIMIALESKVGTLPTNLDKWLPVEKISEPAETDGKK